MLRRAGSSSASGPSAPRRSAPTTPSCSASAIGSALRGLPRPGVLPALLEDLDLEDDGARDGPLDGALAPGAGRRAVRPPALDDDLFEAVLLGYTHLQPAQGGGPDDRPRDGGRLRVVHVSRLGHRRRNSAAPAAPGHDTCLARMRSQQGFGPREECDLRRPLSGARPASCDPANNLLATGFARRTLGCLNGPARCLQKAAPQTREQSVCEAPFARPHTDVTPM